MSDQLQPYVAVLLFESTSPSPGYRTLYREDVTLVHGHSVEEATAEAERHARAQETSYDNDRGETITSRFLRTVDVNHVLDEDLTTTADLYCRHFRDIDSYRRFEPKLDGEL